MHPLIPLTPAEEAALPAALMAMLTEGDGPEVEVAPEDQSEETAA